MRNDARRALKLLGLYIIINIILGMFVLYRSAYK